ASAGSGGGGGAAGVEPPSGGMGGVGGSSAICPGGGQVTCAVPAATSSTTTLTVTVDTSIGLATHVASGGLEGLAVGNMPPDALLLPLKPKVFTQAADTSSPGLNPTADALKVAPQAARAGAQVAMRVADVIDSYPYQWPGWTQWLAMVDQVVSARAVSGAANILGYDLWNEPNLNWPTAAGTFDQMWARTFAEIRVHDKTTPTIGPSWTSYNDALMRDFLTNAKSAAALPDFVSWHELQGSTRIAGDIAAYRALEKSLGLSPRPISINEYGRRAELGVPGSLIGYIAQFERYGVHDACLGNWYPPLGSFDGLIVDNSKPNGAWWLYKWYGDMSGQMVAVTAATQSGLDGAAAVAATDQNVSIIFGGAAGTGDIRISGFDHLACYGANAQVTLEHVVSSGRTVAVSGTTTISKTTMPICGGVITIHATDLVAADGYHLLVQPSP
ncbi:MAG TPA: hypothetical protein VFG23_02420, partial [Polyangia bacterium]|nr:hypothetical protein [Polyangia bacterium]